MNIAYLLIGGNIGNRVANLKNALEAIGQQAGTVKEISDVFETAAWGMEDQPSFLNQALELHTPLQPKALLDVLLQVEKTLGRERDQKWGPRLIDIDILLFNDDVVEEEGLKIPHPQMPYRRFVLQPLAQIAGDKIHPLLHQSIYEMLLHCPDPLEVHKFN